MVSARSSVSNWGRFPPADSLGPTDPRVEHKSITAIAAPPVRGFLIIGRWVESRCWELSGETNRASDAHTSP